MVTSSGNGPSAVEDRRLNWTTATMLICDNRNRPVRLKHGTDMSYWQRNASAQEPDSGSDVIRVSRA